LLRLFTRLRLVHDETGVFGLANSYISYQDPFFSANRAPGSAAPLEPPGTRSYVFPAADVDFAQIQVGVTGWAMNSGTAEPQKLRVSIRDAGGILRTQTLGYMAPGNPKEWAFNAPLGIYPNDPLTEQTGIYSCAFLNVGASPPDTPVRYQVKVQFCERADVATILCLPIDTANPTVVLEANPNNITLTSQPSLTDLQLTTDPHSFFYDSVLGVIYVKTTTKLFWGGEADDEGTRNVLTIQ